MAKFLFIYRGSPDEFEKFSPEEVQKHMQKWGSWIEDGFRKGWLVDPAFLTPEGRLVNSKKVVTDGPLSAKEVVGGHSVVQAETIGGSPARQAVPDWRLADLSESRWPAWAEAVNGRTDPERQQRRFSNLTALLHFG